MVTSIIPSQQKSRKNNNNLSSTIRRRTPSNLTMLSRSKYLLSNLSNLTIISISLLLLSLSRTTQAKSIEQEVQSPQNENAKTGAAVINKRASHDDFMSAFIASISVILVSEIGDKTFFIAAIMSATYARLTVFSGAMSALGGLGGFLIS